MFIAMNVQIFGKVALLHIFAIILMTECSCWGHFRIMLTDAYFERTFARQNIKIYEIGDKNGQHLLPTYVINIGVA